jgi:hypothetical protein
LAINLVGSLQRENFMTASVVHTLKSVFDQVDIYPVIAKDSREQTGNLVVVAYRGAPRKPDNALHASEPVHSLARDLVRHTLTNRFSFPADTPAILLTDDFNPIDLRDLWLKEEVRRDILKTTDPDILLG